MVILQQVGPVPNGSECLPTSLSCPCIKSKFLSSFLYKRSVGIMDGH